MEILQPRPYFQGINIAFRKLAGCDWQHNGKARESIPYSNGPRPDHDIVFMPFCTLQNVKQMTIKPSSREMDGILGWCFIDYGQDFIPKMGTKWE